MRTKNEVNRRLFLKWANLVGLAAWFPAAAKSSPLPMQDANAAASRRSFPTRRRCRRRKPFSSKITARNRSTKFPSQKSTRPNSPSSTCTLIPTPRLPSRSRNGLRTWMRLAFRKRSSLTMATGAEFDDIYRKYSKYPDRFEMWCGFDLSGYNKPGFGPAAVKELERCRQVGARGVGEIHDKGSGLVSGKSKAPGMHPDDPRMDALLGEMRRTWHADQPACRRADLDVPENGQDQRRPDERLQLATRQ